MTDVFPHSKEAEDAAISSVLINPDAYNDAAYLVTADDFYIQRNQWMWDAFISIAEKGIDIDVMTVAEELRRMGRHSEIGGDAFITSMVTAAPISSNIESYVKIVRDYSVKRKIIKASRDATRYGFDLTLNADESLQRSFEAFEEISPEYNPYKDPLGDRILAAYIDASEKGDVPGVPTGLIGLDKILGGYMDEDFVLIGARPGEGKTGMLLTSFLSAINTGHRAALFSLEMGDISVGQRVIAQRATLNTFRIRRGRLEADEVEKLRQGTEWINDVIDGQKALIDEKPSIGTSYIHSVCKRLKARGLLDIAFVDYVQLMNGKGNTLYEQITNVSKGLKKIAKDLHIPVVSAAQLKRDAEGRRPNKSDLKETGSLEQDADVIIFIWREGDLVLTSDIDLSVKMSVAKHRNGPVGDLAKNGESTVQFRRSCTRFEDIQI